jgi:hypothetical protein
MHSQASKEVLFIACKVSAEVYFMPPKAKGDIVLTCSSFRRTHVGELNMSIISLHERFLLELSKVMTFLYGHKRY